MATYFEQKMQDYMDMIEKRLEELLSQNLNKDYERLTDAMKYSVLNGGKRIRGILCLAFSETFDGDKKAALDFACAIEMLHAYTLIHDDLPCMDDDDMRRGRPSCHIAFDEATAVLAGDALLTYAFDVISSVNSIDDKKIVKAIKTLSSGAGYYGVVGGQIMDIINEDKKITENKLKSIHKLKTGKLIVSSVQLGLLTTDCTKDDFSKSVSYAESLGLSFQIIDDILDYVSTDEVLGKPAQSDVGNDKTTYISLLGENGAKELAFSEHKKSLSYLSQISKPSEFLVDLTNNLIKRKF